MALGVTQTGEPDWKDNGWQSQVGGVVPNDDIRQQRSGAETSPDDPSLIAALQKLYQYETDVRQPRQLNWDRTWARFWNKWDFRNKRPWQSKKGLPHVTIMALKFAWELIKPIILAGDKFFEVTTVHDPYKEVMNVPRNMVMHFLDLKSENRTNSNFITGLYDAYVGMILNDVGHMMVMPENEGMTNWSPEEDPFGEPTEEETPAIDDLLVPDVGAFGLDGSTPQKQEDGLLSVDEASNEFRIRFEAINPRMVLVDTSSGSEQHYKMYVQTMSPWQFRKMANAYGWENVEEVIASAATSGAGTDKVNSSSRDHREKQQGGIYNKYKCIEVVHVMGSPPDQNGELLFENQYCVWADKFVVQPPTDLGLWHKRVPIVSAAMVKVPWAPYGLSLCGLNMDSQEARVELFNGILDYLNQVINPPTEIDHDQLHPSYGVSQVSKGVYPGMTVQVQKMGRNFPAISRTMMQGIEPGVWQGLGWMKQEAAEATGLADTGAMPRTRNRISAKEFQERNAAASGLWQQIAFILEKLYVEPILEQAYYVGLQCCTQTQWEMFVQMEIDKVAPATQDGAEPNPLVQKLEAMKKWKAKERWNKLAPVPNFKVKVYSAMESKRELLEKVSSITEMGERVPQFAQRVRWHKVAEMGMMGLEEDPDTMLWPDKGATAEQPMVGTESGEGGMAGAPPVTVAPPPGQESLE